MDIRTFQNHCCGCGECYAACPVSAIRMVPNSQGFYYPEVDPGKCIHCSLCVKHCAFNSPAEKHDILQAYAFKHADPEVRAQSRSGGIFTALSDCILETGGVVYGCILANPREAVHIRATTEEDRNKMRGSKYIQSRTHDILEPVRQDLLKGLWVLFSGTPCQVNAVADYCKDVDTSRLLLMDIVCHGVPSPKVWKDYLHSVSRQHKKEILDVTFRDKQKFGWASHRDTVTFTDRSEVSGNVFTKLFYSHHILRKDCFDCPFKTLQRTGDITIADCWGIAEQYPEYDDNRGVSLVLVNSEKGQDFFRKVKNTSTMEVDVQKFLQPPLRENWAVPEDYDSFWKYYHTHSFRKVVDRFVFHRLTVAQRVRRKISHIAGKLLRSN